jgi:hypothetical protein
MKLIALVPFAILSSAIPISLSDNGLVARALKGKSPKRYTPKTPQVTKMHNKFARWVSTAVPTSTAFLQRLLLLQHTKLLRPHPMHLPQSTKRPAHHHHNMETYQSRPSMLPRLLPLPSTALKSHRASLNFWWQQQSIWHCKVSVCNIFDDRICVLVC